MIMYNITSLALLNVHRNIEVDVQIVIDRELRENVPKGNNFIRAIVL